jgi:hypothetical protein
VIALALAVLLTCQTGGSPPSPPPEAEEDPGDPEPDESIAYPLGRFSVPDFAAPGTPFKLVDLDYRVSDTFSTTQAFAARVRVLDRGFLGAEFEGERRALTLETQRLVVSAGGREQGYDFFASYRARRFMVSADAERDTASGSKGWLLSPSVSIRLGSDFELLGALNGDTRRPYERFLRTASLGFLWQRAAWLEASGEYVHAREAADGHFENTRNTASLSLVAQLGPSEVTAAARLDDTKGRFPRTETDLALADRWSLAPRLLLEGQARLLLERSRERSHDYRAALTWFGRRFTLPRSGASGQRSLALARRATEMGYNERRVFDETERRHQRERLALAPRREELRGEMTELYRAQVRERPVPVLGVEVLDSSNALDGSKSRITRVLIGMPWPPAWPWQARENSVPFLRLDLERERQLSGLSYETLSHGASLAVALSREMDLVLSWRLTGATPLDLIRGIGERRTIELSYVYAFGR